MQKLKNTKILYPIRPSKKSGWNIYWRDIDGEKITHYYVNTALKLQCKSIVLCGIGGVFYHFYISKNHKNGIKRPTLNLALKVLKGFNVDSRVQRDLIIRSSISSNDYYKYYFKGEDNGSWNQ
jgi:hypothetical protein